MRRRAGAQRVHDRLRRLIPQPEATDRSLGNTCETDPGSRANCGNSGPACQTASAGYAATVLAIAASYATTTDTSPVATQAVQVALGQVGTPYLWGGERPGGFDCSGLVQYAYARAGLALPLTAQQQYDATTHLPSATDLQPGDLIFFGTGPQGVDHVGIALGDGRMVDAPHTGALVRVETAYVDASDFVGATRPTTSA